LSQQTQCDAFTGLPNRRALAEALELAFTQPPLSLLLINIDHFKIPNYRQGDVVGDRYLIRSARTIEGQALGHIVYRIGGDEFALIVPDIQAAPVIAENIRAAIEKEFEQERRQHYRYDDLSVMTVSIGVGLIDGGSLKLLWELVEQAMWKAKEAGGNRVVLELRFTR
jgi:diguanylate cyclase (GGDEF)-like protein